MIKIKENRNKITMNMS